MKTEILWLPLGWAYILPRGNVLVSAPSEGVTANQLARRYYLGSEFYFQRYRSKIKYPYTEEEIKQRHDESVINLDCINFDSLDIYSLLN